MEYTIDQVLELKRNAVASLRRHSRYMHPKFSRTIDRFAVVFDDILEDMASGGLDIEPRETTIPIDSKIKALNWLAEFLDTEVRFIEHAPVQTEYRRGADLCRALVLDYMFLEMARTI